MIKRITSIKDIITKLTFSNRNTQGFRISLRTIINWLYIAVNGTVIIAILNAHKLNVSPKNHLQILPEKNHKIDVANIPPIMEQIKAVDNKYLKLSNSSLSS